MKVTVHAFSSAAAAAAAAAAAGLLHPSASVAAASAVQMIHRLGRLLCPASGRGINRAAIRPSLCLSVCPFHARSSTLAGRRGGNTRPVCALRAVELPSAGIPFRRHPGDTLFGQHNADDSQQTEVSNESACMQV